MDRQQQTPSAQQEEKFALNLQDNEMRIKELFYFPTNQALQLRKIYFACLKREGLIVYLKGAVVIDTIETHIVKPLIVSEGPTIDLEKSPIAASVLEHVLTTTNGTIIDDFAKLSNEVVNGKTIILIDRCAEGISVETSGFESRSVEKPSVESAVKGPKEAFIESMYVNLSLIRKQVRSRELICEVLHVGERSTRQVSMLYMKGIADPELVDKVKYRIKQISSDTILTLSILEQHIEERPYSIISTTLMTERTDRASGFLLEGHIVLLMDSSPAALIVPVTFWALFHTAEDQYMRWPVANLIRIVRLLAMFIALFVPAMYIAISTFHSEMLPTDLMLAIAANREQVPFSSILELIFMEVSFEILREAGIRIPTVIGPTIGIVGALILGQSAVEANIVSPIMVIVVAVTGLSSFAIPEVSLSYAVRIGRFAMLIAATFIGFFGIALMATFYVAYLSSVKSFEVPFLSPLAPSLPSSKDLVVRPPVWKQWIRPTYASPQDTVRMKKPEGK